MSDRMVGSIAVTVLVGAVLMFFWGLWALFYPQAWLLRSLHQALDSWGLSIIGTVVLNRLASVVIQRLSRTAARLRALKPQLDAIQQRHPDDKVAKNREIYQLYQQHNITGWTVSRPLLFVPLMVWMGVGIYVALWRMPELHGAAFVWVPDLRAPDPRYFWPLIYVGLMALWMTTWVKAAQLPVQGVVAAVVVALVTGVISCFLPACWLVGWCTGMVLSLGHKGVRRLVGGGKGEEEE